MDCCIYVHCWCCRAAAIKIYNGGGQSDLRLDRLNCSTELFKNQHVCRALATALRRDVYFIFIWGTLYGLLTTHDKLERKICAIITTDLSGLQQNMCALANEKIALQNTWHNHNQNQSVRCVHFDTVFVCLRPEQARRTRGPFLWSPASNLSLISEVCGVWHDLPEFPPENENRADADDPFHIQKHCLHFVVTNPLWKVFRSSRARPVSQVTRQANFPVAS